MKITQEERDRLKRVIHTAYRRGMDVGELSRRAEEAADLRMEVDCQSQRENWKDLNDWYSSLKETPE